MQNPDSGHEQAEGNAEGVKQEVSTTLKEAMLGGESYTATHQKLWEVTHNEDNQKMAKEGGFGKLFGEAYNVAENHKPEEGGEQSLQESLNNP